MESNALSEILVIVLGIMIFVLMILAITYIILSAKERNKKLDEPKKIKEKAKNSKSKKQGNAQATEYTKQSIMDFMEFDKVEDNMIVQRNGKRYLMVVECQGVNYDLMSGVEKVGVEEGFQQFLNTLRHPIQIYIQTRTINLESSIATYKEKVNEIETNYNRMMYEYNRMKTAGIYSKDDIDKYLFEVTKQRNLLEYGRDIVSNTEKMSLNKNVLNKKYYIILSYFAEDMGNEKYDVEEIKNMAFSELYTKAQSLIRTLSSCSVGGKILSSKELIELLYVAYNRDESESFGIDRALKAGYDELYSTAPDVFEKKIKVLDEMIQSRAIDLANKAVEKAKTKSQQIAEEKEQSLDALVEKMAEIILNDNKQYVGEDIAQKAIKEIKKDEKEGEEANEKVEKKSTRGRKKKATN